MIDKLIKALHRCCGTGNSGAAAVEFAITMPILVVLALGIVDYGTIMTNTASLQGATRAIAEYAKNSSVCNVTGNAGSFLQNSTCLAGIGTLVTTLKSSDTSLSSASFTYPTANLSAAGGNYCTCVDGTVVSCSTGTCSVGTPPDKRVLQYIRITGTQSVSPLVAYAPLGLPSSLSLSGQTTIRIE